MKKVFLLKIFFLSFFSPFLVIADTFDDPYTDSTYINASSNVTFDGCATLDAAVTFGSIVSDDYFSSIDDAELNNYRYTLCAKPGNSNTRVQLSTDTGTTYKNHLGETLAFGEYLFDGTNDVLQATDDDDFTFSLGAGDDSPLTFMFWITPISFSGGDAVLTKYGTSVGAREYSIGVNSQKIDATFYDSNSDYIGKQTDFTLSTGRNYHIAIVYTGNEANSGVSIYIDGQEIRSNDFGGGTYNGMSNTTTDLVLGAGNNGGANYTNCTMSDVRMYARALTEEELYDYVFYTKEPTSTSLRVHYKMNGNANDSSGNGHTAAVVGAVNTTTLSDLPPFGTSLITEADQKTTRFPGAKTATVAASGQVVPSAGEFAISLWAKRNITATAAQANGDIDTGRPTGTGGVFGQYWNTEANRLAGIVSSEGARYQIGATKLDATGAVAAGEWGHYVFQRNASDEMEIYINGTLTTGSVNTTTVDDQPLTIGYYAEGSVDNHFEGDIRNFAVYDDSLSQAEVDEIYETGYSDISHEDIINYWTLADDLEDKVGSLDLTASGVTIASDLYAPIPLDPTAKTIDISIFGEVSAYNTRHLLGIKADFRPGLDSSGVDYTLPSTGLRIFGSGLGNIYSD